VWTLMLTALIVFVSGVLFFFNPSEHFVKSSNVPVAVETARGFLNVVRDALKGDANWADCSGADQYCNDTDSNGMFPIYSGALGEKLEDVDTDQGFKVTAKMKPLDSNTAVVVVSVEGKGIDYNVGVKFVRGEGVGALPLVYAGSSYVYGGNACSYYWDGRQITGITNPDFYVYLDDKFKWSPTIVVPTNPAGDNPKSVVFATNFDTLVQGYKDIDTVYTTGDLYLEDGAQLGLAYADGNVYVDDQSSADKIVENGSFQYPDFNDTIPDNSVSSSGSQKIYCGLFGNQTIVLPPGQYYELLVFKNCKLYLSEGTYSFEKIDVFSNLNVYYDGDVTLEVDKLYSSQAKLTTIPNKSGTFFLKGNSVILYKSDLVCDDNPKNCYVDTNKYDLLYSSAVGYTVLARNKAYLYDSTQVGNLFGEDLVAEYSNFCNVVDSSGNQLYAGGEDFYHLVAPNGISIPTGLQEIERAVCKDESDCLNQLTS